MIDNFLKTINEDVAMEGYQRAVSEQIENGLIRDMYMGLVNEALDNTLDAGPEPSDDADKLFESIQDPFEFLEEEMDASKFDTNAMKQQAKDAAKNVDLKAIADAKEKMAKAGVSEADIELEMYIDPNPVLEGCDGKECLDCDCNMTNAARPNNGGGMVAKAIDMLPGSDPRSVGSYFSDMDDVSVDGTVKESDVSYLLELIPETKIV